MNEKVRKRGRPSKLTPKVALKIFYLSRRGFTDKEIADLLDFAEQTITNWKKDSDFLGFLNASKKEADKLVIRSLFERAVGYSHPEEKVFCTKDGEIVTHDCIRHYPPDPTSAIFWLKNRRPHEWKDKHDVDLGDELTNAAGSIARLFRKRYEGEAERLAKGEDPALVLFGRSSGGNGNGRSEDH